MNKEFAGSIAGAVATAPMTATMMALHRMLPRHQQTPLPPHVAAENAADAVGAGEAMDAAGEDGRKGVALAAHFSYGAAAGAAYAPLAGKSGLHPAAEGALYGLAVWGGSYLGLMPATGLYNSATDEPAERNIMMIAAHVVWGASLGIVFNLLSHGSRER
jgi:putative membrane protein